MSEELRPKRESLVTKLDVTARAETASRNRAGIWPGCAANGKSLRFLGVKVRRPGRDRTDKILEYFLEASAVFSALLFYARTYETMDKVGSTQRGFEASLASA